MANFVRKGTALAQQVMVLAKPKLDVFMKYAKEELTPPSPADIPIAIENIRSIFNSARTGAFKNITVREVGLNALVTMEVIFWFYIGECIGKRHLVGYDV